MALILKDRVRETSNVAGTADAVLLGAVTGFQAFSVVGNTNTCYYTIADNSGNWEVGIGTYSTTGPTLARTTVLDSSSGGTKVNFPAGNKDVFLTYPAEVAVTTDITNTFTEPQVISTNSSTNALRITQTGAGNALLVEDESNPDASPFLINANGRVLVGTTASALTTENARLQIEQGGAGAIVSSRSTNDNAGSWVMFYKTRGASGTATVVQSGDTLGILSWQGADGTTGIRAADIKTEVDGTPGTNDMPGRLVFSTTADGASSPTERMRITSAGSVGIGGTPAAGRTLEVAKSITGSTGSMGILSSGQIQSDVTSQVRLFSSFASTQATSFTLGQLWHYYATQGTIGVGSAVTSQMGFLAENTLIGATNNFGFYSNIASGTGRWNFYANGTAANYFAGNVGIGTTTTTNKLEIGGSGDSLMRLLAAGQANGLEIGQLTADGSSEVFAVNNNFLAFGTNNTERMRITAGGNIGIGTSTPVGKFSAIGGAIQLSGGTAAQSGLRIQNASGVCTITGINQDNNAFNALGFYTAATEAIRIDTSNNVGIGTTSPATKVEISGTAAANNLALRITNTATDGYSTLQMGDANAGIYRNGSAQTGYAGASSLNLITVSTHPIGFSTQNTLRMIIDSSGNVGIGNTVASTINTENNSGNLVVGAGNTTDGITVYSGTTSIGALCFADGTTTTTTYAGYLQYLHASDAMAFGTGAAERMRIDSAGNVGIGTSSIPAWSGRALHISARSSFAAVGTADTQVTTNAFWTGTQWSYINTAAASNYYQEPSAATPHVWRYAASGTAGNAITWSEAMRITSGGEVYIAGTTDQGAFNLQCNGTGVWGAGAYTNGSDARIKDDIAPIDSGLDVVQKLNPVTYKYKEDWSKDQSTQTGFIAQELLVALEGKNYVDGVVTQGGEYMSVAYQNIIPILTKAIQEQQALIENLTTRLNALEGK
jgi:hypothetical protein